MDIKTNNQKGQNGQPAAPVLTIDGDDLGFGATTIELIKIGDEAITQFTSEESINVDSDADLLGVVKVSHITSIPCILKGKIIGRGNPGCIFNEDFVIKDETGIIFLDYNQPLFLINKIFALFKSKEYFDKEVEVVGWYRRNPVPYVEIYKYTVDGKEKKIFTYPLGIAGRVILLVLGVFLMFM